MVGKKFGLMTAVVIITVASAPYVLDEMGLLPLNVAVGVGEAGSTNAGNAAVIESLVIVTGEGDGAERSIYGGNIDILKPGVRTPGIHNISQELDRGAARISDDVYPTGAVEINDLTPNGPVLADHDFFGTSVASLGDLDGDGVPDLAVGAERDNAGGDGKSAVYVMMMNRDGTVKSTSEINDLTPNGPVLADYELFGISLASMGDLDGDGVPDLAAGATRDGAGGPSRGAVHVMLMNADGTVKSTSEINDLTPNGPVLADYEHFGSSVTLLDDLDGDGVHDLAVGARLDSAGGIHKGAVHVMLMNADGTVKSTSEINDLTPNGPVLAERDYFGKAMASLGDLDGDGVPDLAVGGYQDDASGTNSGAVHVMLMNADGTVKSTSEINGTTLNGPVLTNHDYFGASLAAMGDLDGDGVPDLAAGAYADDAGGDDKGTVHVMLMNRDGTVKSTSEINDLTPNGPVLADSDNFGISLAPMGDLDGDGMPDLVAGILGGNDADGVNRGAVHIITLGSVAVDRTPPVLTGAVLDERTGVLALTFSKKIDVTPPDNVRLDRIFIGGGASETNRTALTGAALNSTSDGLALTVTLTAAQLQSAAALATVQLDIETSAVHDMFANPIATSTGNPVTVLGRVPLVAPPPAPANLIATPPLTLTTPPTAPANLTATSTTTSVTLTWDDPGDDSITGYKILSRTPATQPGLTVLVNDTGSADSTYTVDGLEPATGYEFGVVALGDHDESQTSKLVSIHTKKPPPPAAPTNLQASSTTDSVTLTWDDPGDDSITGYKILSRIPSPQTTLSVLVADTGSADHTYTVDGLEPGTKYAFRIIALTDHGESKVSKFVSIHTKKPPPPAAPTNLQASSTTDSVTLTWDDPGDDSITGYKILSRTPATQPRLSVLVADTGSADHTYTVDGLEPGTKYVFRVVALSDYGKSKASLPVSVFTER